MSPKISNGHLFALLRFNARTLAGRLARREGTSQAEALRSRWSCCSTRSRNSR